MTTIQASSINLSFGERDILKNVSLTLTTKSRVALSGGNGSGKTTLLRILSGESKPDGGIVSIPRNVRNYYLPQSGIVFKENSILEECDRAFDHLLELTKLQDDLGKELETAKEERHKTLLDEYNRVHENIIESGYYSREADITQVLTGLGFNLADFNKKMSELSGGWQMRVALAKALLTRPKTLLLDEPTNYLDIEARDWLAGFLKNFTGGILIVSHDKYFLDQVVDSVAELFSGDLKIYKGNYSKYEKLRELELEDLLARYRKQQEEIAKHENFIRRFKSKATKATQAQSHVKQLEKIEVIEIPSSLKKIKIDFPPPPHSGKNVIDISGLGKSFGEKVIINGLDLNIQRGEKIVIAGQNGAGKSTLLRILAGVDNKFSGKVKYGTDVRIGYFSQDHHEALDMSNTILEELEQESPMDLIPKLRGLLGAFLFHGDDVFKSISVLSGGEKNRVSLLKILLKPFNLLILDEPTNHLDLNSKDVLLDALRSYQGTLLFVSHDRYFIEGLAQRVLHLENGTHRLFLGDYKYYREKLVNLDLGATEDSPVGVSIEVIENKLARDEDKKLKNLINKLERVEKEILDEIHKTEIQRQDLTNKLGLKENYIDPNKSRELQDKINSLLIKEDNLANKWEETLLELEEAREKRGV
jgi:ATP-binding cassette, subfamily F, member 3